MALVTVSWFGELGASEKLERFLLLNTGVHVGEDLEGHCWLTSGLPQKQRPEEEIWREETWVSGRLGWELWCASVKWWNGLGWAGYWTCLDSWPHVIRTGLELDIPPALGTSADWAYLYRHCKNFEDALKLIKSIIVKSYFKINSHLHLQVSFFVLFLNLDQGASNWFPE